jgi:hypothetical protein
MRRRIVNKRFNINFLKKKRKRKGREGNTINPAKFDNFFNFTFNVKKFAMCPNKVFKIFNVTLSLAISVFFDGKKGPHVCCTCNVHCKLSENAFIFMRSITEML